MAKQKINSQQQSADGWISPDEAWTYASAQTFTVPGDQTAKYTKGTRVKWSQTTVKYGVVISSTYGAPNTTVTIATNTDYTIANAAITDNYYSYQGNPQGYPIYFNFTPNVTCPSGTAPTYVTKAGTFQINNGIVSVNIWCNNASGGTAGASANPLFCSIPVPPKAGLLTLGSGVHYEATGTMGGNWARYGDASTFYFHSYSFANLTGDDQSSANRYLGFSLNYPMA